MQNLKEPIFRFKAYDNLSFESTVHKSIQIGEKEHMNLDKPDRSTFKSVHDFIDVSKHTYN